MKKFFIALSLGSVFLLIGAAYGYMTLDFGVQKHALMQQSKNAENEARMYSCKQIGDLTSRCYQTHGRECSELQAAETEHIALFQENAYEVCAKQTLPVPEQGYTEGVDTPKNEETYPADVPPPSQGKEDPLFFGDEEGN